MGKSLHRSVATCLIASLFVQPISSSHSVQPLSHTPAHFADQALSLPAADVGSPSEATLTQYEMLKLALTNILSRHELKTFQKPPQQKKWADQVKWKLQDLAQRYPALNAGLTQVVLVLSLEIEYLASLSLLLDDDDPEIYQNLQKFLPPIRVKEISAARTTMLLNSHLRLSLDLSWASSSAFPLNPNPMEVKNVGPRLSANHLKRLFKGRALQHVLHLA